MFFLITLTLLLTFCLGCLTGSSLKHRSAYVLAALFGAMLATGLSIGGGTFSENIASYGDALWLRQMLWQLTIGTTAAFVGVTAQRYRLAK